VGADTIDRGRETQVANRYPQPIADEYKRAWSLTTPSERHAALLQVAGNTLHYLAAVAWSEYRYKGHVDAKVEKIVAQHQGRNISTGTWLDLFRHAAVANETSILNPNIGRKFGADVLENAARFVNTWNKVKTFCKMGIQPHGWDQLLNVDLANKKQELSVFEYWETVVECRNHFHHPEQSESRKYDYPMVHELFKALNPVLRASLLEVLFLPEVRLALADYRWAVPRGDVLYKGDDIFSVQMVYRVGQAEPPFHLTRKGKIERAEYLVRVKDQEPYVRFHYPKWPPAWEDVGAIGIGPTQPGAEERYAGAVLRSLMDDGRIDDKERAFLRIIADACGLDDAQVGAIETRVALEFAANEVIEPPSEPALPPVAADGPAPEIEAPSGWPTVGTAMLKRIRDRVRFAEEPLTTSDDAALERVRQGRGRLWIQTDALGGYEVHFVTKYGDTVWVVVAFASVRKLRDPDYRRIRRTILQSCDPVPGRGWEPLKSVPTRLALKTMKRFQIANLLDEDVLDEVVSVIGRLDDYVRTTKEGELPEPPDSTGEIRRPESEEVDWPGAGRAFLKRLRDAVIPVLPLEVSRVSTDEELDEVVEDSEALALYLNRIHSLHVWFLARHRSTVHVVVGFYSDHSQRDPVYRAAREAIEAHCDPFLGPGWLLKRSSYDLGLEAVKQFRIPELADDQDEVVEAVRVLSEFVMEHLEDVQRLVPEEEPEEELPPLESHHRFEGVWLPRLLWAMEYARRNDLEPVAAADIARIVTEQTGTLVQGTNTARAFRNHPEWEEFWEASDGQRYAINDTGRQLLRDILDPEVD